MKAVILAGGRGSRFGALTIDRPKPLIEVAGKALICHVLDALPAVIDEVIVVLGYRGEMIERDLGCVHRGRLVRYAWQEEPGTGGALLAARAVLQSEDRFLVLGADDIFDRDELEILIDPHSFAGAARETIEESWASYGIHYGLSGKHSTMSAVFDGCQRLTGFRTVSNHTEKRFFGVGSYVLPQAIFEQPTVRLPNGEWSIPHMLAQVNFPVYCVPFQNWLPVNTPSERDHAESELSKALVTK